MEGAGRIKPDGVNAKLWENHGPIDGRAANTLFSPRAMRRARNA